MKVFAELDPRLQAEALNEVYKGYPVPFNVTPEWIAEHMLVNDIRPDLSPLLWNRGLVGLGLLGLRDSRAWIGGFGIVPRERGAGHSHALIRKCLEIARAAGASTVQLEVLQDNSRAQSCYERAGFATRRQVAVLEGRPGRLPEGPAAEPGWQREPSTLHRLRDLEKVGGVHYRKRQIFLLQHWPDLGRLPEGLYRLSNEPVDSPLHQALLGLGWREVVRQREMFHREVGH